MKPDVLIHRDKYIELAGCTTQELAVLKPGSPGADNCLNVVTAKFRCEVVGERLVKQDALRQRARPSLGRERR